MNNLIWIVYAAIMGFLVPFLFGNNKSLPVDIYYLIYFTAVSVFFVLYIKTTGFDIRKSVSTNLILGIALGLIFALIMAKNVLSRPETTKIFGGAFFLALFWRGALYGFIDGLFLSAFPYIVTWRVFGVSGRPIMEKIGFGLLAWIFVLLISSAYHLGYKDFRSQKVFQADFGNTLMSIPTFLSGNPIASAITHAGMHISAVVHSPETDLFLPPHR